MPVFDANSGAAQGKIPAAASEIVGCALFIDCTASGTTEQRSAGAVPQPLGAEPALAETLPHCAPAFLPSPIVRKPKDKQHPEQKTRVNQGEHMKRKRDHGNSPRGPQKMRSTSRRPPSAGANLARCTARWAARSSDASPLP